MNTLNSCWIMAGGPSAKKKLKVDGDIIVVNRDIERYYEAKYFITMDNRFTLWHPQSLIDSPATKFFIVGMNNKYIKCDKGFVDVRFGITYELTHYDIIVKSFNTDGMGTHFGDFRTGCNSGYCALQLALILGYKNINLVGFDLSPIDGKFHHHDGYKRCKDDNSVRLSSFAEKFLSAIPEIKRKFPDVCLTSYSPVSPLNSLIPYKSSEPYETRF